MLKDEPFLVSVVTPVHNSVEFLQECMDSVIGQTYGNWEHILVDDRSTDESVALIESYLAKDARIKLIKLQKNSGAGVARNTAIAAAKGNYIAFLDSDDQWYPTKLEKQLTFMRKGEHHFTHTSYDKRTESGDIIGKVVRAKPRLSYAQALYKNTIGCLTVMYSVDHFGKQYMPKIRKRQDYALWLHLLKDSDAYGLDECLSSYRVRKESISSNKLKLIKYEWSIYRDVEGLSLAKSLFYLLSAIFIKMKSYF